MKYNELTDKEKEIYDRAFNDGVEEGIVIEKSRILDHLQEYITNPDVDWDLLMEWIEA